MNTQFMERAVRMAVENAESLQGGPFAALIVQNGVVIGEGTNRVTTTNDPTAHAEIVAIRDACTRLGRFDLSDCELYTTCEPCPMCLGAIYWAHLKTIYFACSRSDAARAGFDDDFIYEEISRPMEERKIRMIQVDRDAGIKAFETWKSLAEKVPY